MKTVLKYAVLLAAAAAVATVCYAEFYAAHAAPSASRALGL